MGPLEEQEVFLMAGPFLQPLLFVLFCFETGPVLVIFLIALNRIPHRGNVRKKGFVLSDLWFSELCVYHCRKGMLAVEAPSMMAQGHGTDSSHLGGSNSRKRRAESETA